MEGGPFLSGLNFTEECLSVGQQFIYANKGSKTANLVWKHPGSSCCHRLAADQNEQQPKGDFKLIGRLSGSTWLNCLQCKSCLDGSHCCTLDFQFNWINASYHSANVNSISYLIEKLNRERDDTVSLKLLSLDFALAPSSAELSSFGLNCRLLCHFGRFFDKHGFISFFFYIFK